MAKKEVQQEKVDSIMEKLETSINEFTNLRKNPLLILYWSNSDGEITDLDVEVLEKTLDSFCVEKEIESIGELDVIIYTRGGAVNASYLLAQIIRGYAKRVNMFVPKHAYSGGTVISLCSDKIFMGLNSKLSPIDIQLGGRMALMDIEKYIEFIAHSTSVLGLEDEESRFPVLIELLKELTKNLHPTKLGDLFRLRSLAEYYSRILLIDYMFRTESERVDKATDVIKRLTSESPTHHLDIDINIARGIGLKVGSLNGKLYKLGQLILDCCLDLELMGVICDYPSRECKLRMPYFEIFD